MPSLDDRTGAARAPGDRSRAGDRRIAFVLFVLTLTVYAATMCRTVYTGDDGDFITAMATFGTSHPTGYPLFTLLGRLFIEIIPFGSPALRVNLMTALFGAASVALFYRFAALLINERFWAATAALLFGFAPTLWQQSLSCEVYSLTCFFLASLLYLAALWHRRPDDTGTLRLLAVTYGLALTNHLTAALFLPGFLALVFGARRTLWREGRVLLSLAALFALPLLLYAYLPLSARSNPPVSWGNPVTLPTFWAHVTGAQYRGLMFDSTGLMWLNAQDYARYLVREYGLWTLWLVPAGVAALWRQTRSLCLLLLYVWAANVLYAVNYNIFDIYVYYLPSYLVTAAFIAAGASAVTRWAWDRRRLTPQRRAHYASLVGVVALAVPVVQMSFHYAGTDKSRNYIEDDFSANILRSAPPNAIIVTGSSVTFTLWYRRWVLGERPDVTLVNWNLARGMFFSDAWYYKHLRRMYPDIRNTYPSRTATDAQAASGEFLLTMMKRAVSRGVPVVFIADSPLYDVRRDGRAAFFDDLLGGAFDRVPWGVGERLYLRGQAPAASPVVAENERLWESFRTRGLYTGWAHADPVQKHIGLRYADAGVALGALAEKAGRYATAKAAYQGSLRLYRIPEASAGAARCARALEAAQQARR